MNINKFLESLESGNEKIIEKKNGEWKLNKDLFGRINEIFTVNKKIYEIQNVVKWADKVDLKSNSLTNDQLINKSFRLVPGSWVRRGSYIGDKVVIMSNAFVNIGSYINEGSMIDSGVTIGSCAYIGKNCHISSNVVIAGVLEPSQYNPVIIEDNVFIGAQSLIAEGMIIPEGCVIGSGTKITSSTKIFNENGDIIERLEPYSVIVPGSYSRGAISLQCAVVIKKVDNITRSKTNINELLR